MANAFPIRFGTLEILLPTIGSAGDVHPVIELGTALRKRGHGATLITNQFFEQQVREAGLDFVPMGTLQEAEQIIADPRLWHPTKSFACIVERAIAPNIERLYTSFGSVGTRERSSLPLACASVPGSRKRSSACLSSPFTCSHRCCAVS